MTTSTTTGLDIQLNELFQDAVKLSQSDKVWDLYRKAEAIPGLGFILKKQRVTNLSVKPGCDNSNEMVKS